MDERTRQVFERAFATIDRVEQCEVEWAAEAAQRDVVENRSQQSVPAGVDAAEWIASRHRHKTYEPAQQQQQQSADTAAAWNKWFSESFRNHIEKYNEVLVEDITEAMGEVISTIRHELRKEFNEALGQVRADLTNQTGIQRGEIAEIKKGVRDVA